LLIPPIQLVGAAVSLLFLAGFSWFFFKSRKGVAMRAVADDQQVAMAMGINVERYFALAWAMAGVVSALGGIVWGNLLGVDVHLALVGFKVFPVVILPSSVGSSSAWWRMWPRAMSIRWWAGAPRTSRRTC
jgi:branched-chain amino acid transport system permease protein